MDIIFRESKKPSKNKIKNIFYILIGVFSSGILLNFTKNLPYPFVFQLMIILVVSSLIYNIMMNNLVTYDYTITKTYLYIERSQGVLNPCVETIKIEDILKIEKKEERGFIKRYGSGDNMYILTHEKGKFAFFPSEEFVAKLKDLNK